MSFSTQGSASFTIIPVVVCLVITATMPFLIPLSSTAFFTSSVIKIISNSLCDTT